MPSFLSTAGPYAWLKPMQPRPSAETSRPFFPSLRFCMSRSRGDTTARQDTRSLPIDPLLYASRIPFALYGYLGDGTADDPQILGRKRYHLYYPRRQSSPAFALLVDAPRYRG